MSCCAVLYVGDAYRTEALAESSTDDRHLNHAAGREDELDRLRR